MRLASKLALAAALLLPAAGCSTMNQIHAQAEGPAAFGGMRYNAARWALKKTTPGDCFAMAVDFPLSFVLDVALLPVSGINEIVEGGIVVTNADPAIDRPDDPKLRRSTH